MTKFRGLLVSAIVTVALGCVVSGCGGQTDDPPGVDRATSIHDLCSSSGGGYTCVCEAGPKVGLTFSTPDCNHFGTAEASVCS